jgi:hypothetical protein
MAQAKSVLEEMELANGAQAFVQISASGHATISFDGKQANYTAWMTRDELKQLARLIKKALEAKP